MSDTRTLSGRIADELAAGADLYGEAPAAAVPTPTEESFSLLKTVRAIKLAVDILRGAGSTVLDKAITPRDMIREGLWSYSAAGGIAGSGNSTVYVGGGSSGTGGSGTGGILDTVPAAPTGFVVAGLLQSIMLNWNPPSYANIAYTEVWRDTANNLAAALLNSGNLIAQPAGTTFVDATAQSGVTYYYWIRAVSIYNRTGPFNSSAGTPGTRTVDPAILISALSGQIRNSELNTALNARIDLIDGPATTAGTVAARVKVETDARVSAVAALSAVKSRTFYSATAPVSDGTYTLQANDTWVDTTSGANKLYRYSGSAWVAADDSRIAQAVTDISNETMNRTTADAAEVAARESLYAGFGGAGGTDYKVFNQAATPTGTGIGDLWTWKTGAGVETFSRWNGSAWVDSLANKRAASYLGEYASSGSFPSSGNVIGDLARATDTNAVSVWNGSGWTVKATAPSPIYAFVEREQRARSDAVSAEASARDTLAVQMRGTYTGTDASAVTTGLVYSERTARVTADSALSTRTDKLEASTSNGAAAPFTALLGWDFNGTANGWQAYPTLDLTVSYDATTIQIRRGSGGDGEVIIERDLAAAEYFPGAKADKVRARVRRLVAGNWYGRCFYGVAGGHREDGSYTKVIPEPTWDADGWATVEWDMSALTSGGNDWLNNTIRYLRLDFFYPVAPGGGCDVDWIAVGSRAGTDLYAAFNSEVTARTSLTDAQASSISTLQAKVNTPSTDGGSAAYNPTYAALQTTQTTLATLDGRANAAYTVRAEVSSGGRTLLGGFGLMGSASSAAGPTIDFGVVANRFYVGAPAGSGVVDETPFIVQATPTIINGVTIPAGVYMKSAFIYDLTASIARLGTAWIDSAMVASLTADKLTAGRIATGEYIQSAAYTTGVGGWKIWGNGNAEFNNVTVRGTVVATAGSIGGIVINSGNIQSSNFIAGTSGFQLTSGGSITAVVGSIAGWDLDYRGFFSPGFSYGTSGTWLRANGQISSFAAGGNVVFDTAQAGSANSVLKLYNALDVKGDGSATFGGQVRVGSNPVVSGTTMTGTGAVFNTSGTFAFGTVSKNMTFDGANVYLNGVNFVAPLFEVFNASISGAWPDYSATISGSGGRPGYTYLWVVQQYSGVGGAIPYIQYGGTSSSCHLTAATPAGGSGVPYSGAGLLLLLVRDTNGRSTFAARNFTYSLDSGGGVGGGD